MFRKQNRILGFAENLVGQMLSITMLYATRPKVFRPNVT